MHPAVQNLISLAIVLSPLYVAAQYGRRSSYSFHAPVSGSQLNSANLINSRVQQRIARPSGVDNLSRLQLNNQQSPTFINLTPQQSVKFDSLRLRDSSQTESARRYRPQDAGFSDATIPERYQSLEGSQKQQNVLERQQLQIQLQQRQLQEQPSSLYDEQPIQLQRKQQSFLRRQQDSLTLQQVQPPKQSRFLQQDHVQWQSPREPQQNPQHSVHQQQDYLQQYDQPVPQDLYQQPIKQQTFPRSQSSYDAQSSQNTASSGHHVLGNDPVQTPSIPAGSTNQGYDQMTLSGFFSNEPHHQMIGQSSINGGSALPSNRLIASTVASASAGSDLHLDTTGVHNTATSVFQTGSVGSNDLQTGSSGSLGGSTGGYLSGSTSLQSGSSLLTSPSLVHPSVPIHQQPSSVILQTVSQKSNAQQLITAQHPAQASATSGGGTQFVSQQGVAIPGQYGSVLTSPVHTSGMALQQQGMYGQSVGHDMSGQAQAGYGMDHYGNGGGHQQKPNPSMTGQVMMRHGGMMDQVGMMGQGGNIMGQGGMMGQVGMMDQGGMMGPGMMGPGMMGPGMMGSGMMGPGMMGPGMMGPGMMGPGMMGPGMMGQGGIMGQGGMMGPGGIIGQSGMMGHTMMGGMMGMGMMGFPFMEMESPDSPDPPPATPASPPPATPAAVTPPAVAPQTAVSLPVAAPAPVPVASPAVIQAAPPTTPPLSVHPPAEAAAVPAGIQPSVPAVGTAVVPGTTGEKLPAAVVLDNVSSSGAVLGSPAFGVGPGFAAASVVDTVSIPKLPHAEFEAAVSALTERTMKAVNQALVALKYGGAVPAPAFVDTSAVVAQAIDAANKASAATVASLTV